MKTVLVHFAEGGARQYVAQYLKVGGGFLIISEHGGRRIYIPTMTIKEVIETPGEPLDIETGREP